MAEESYCTGEDTDTSPGLMLATLCVCDSCVSCPLQLDVEIETLTVQLSETSAAPGQKHHHILRDNSNGK